MKPVLSFLTCWALTHQLLWLSLGSLCNTGAAGLLPDSLGQGPPKVDWVAELYVLNGGWLSLGVGVVERARRAPYHLSPSLVTHSCRESEGGTWTQRLSSPPPWFKVKESTAQRIDVL